MKIGLVINPLAGIGGAAALKGSDGAEIIEKARTLGGQSQAQLRVNTALEKLAGDDCYFYTASGVMGADVLSQFNYSFDVIYKTSGQTSAEDTKSTIRLLIKNRVDLIVFAGGDGTARDVLDVLSLEEDTVPVIGIPAGVKIHSAVYASTPSHAGELMALIVNGEPLSLHEAQVMDLDEDAFRQGKVVARCYGYLSVPVDDTRMQLIKQGGLDHHLLAAQDIAESVIEEMKQDVLYLIGSGSTTAEIMKQLELDNTLLGIDIICNRELLVSDADENTIMSTIQSQPAKIIVTVIGGQGHVFGRGNQQLSARVIRQVGMDNIIIIASNEKLRSLNTRPMIADTGDHLLDKSLSGLYSVVTGYQQKTLYQLI